MHTLVVHTDGGARGNPGPAAIGVVFDAEDGWQQLHERYIGEATNNVAEYQAVLDAVEAMAQIFETQGRPQKIEFYLDSQLVQRQIIGQYKIKEPTLQVLAAKIRQHLQSLATPYTFTHVPRAENKLADKLVNHALDAQAAI